MCCGRRQGIGGEFRLAAIDVDGVIRCSRLESGGGKLAEGTAPRFSLRPRQVDNADSLQGPRLCVVCPHSHSSCSFVVICRCIPRRRAQGKRRNIVLHVRTLFRALLKRNSFSSKAGVEEVIELSPADTLRLAFTATEDDKPGRPHQSFILIEDTSSSLDIVIPVPVKPSGKAKIDIDHRDFPPQLLYVDSLQVSLVVASFGESTPLKAFIARLKPVTNEASPTKPEDPERWLPKPEITHTFRAPQKLPNKQLSFLFSAAVMAGLPLFFVLVPHSKALDVLFFGYFVVEADGS